jgi:alpha-ketoglutarate-dependent 2,4-dichlorophenoxyacetate dioxygenase
MPITIRPLTPVFGAEISGVDLRTADDATFAHIEDAFETHSVLVFPKQNLGDEGQIAFSKRFGALETTQGHIANEEEDQRFPPVQKAIIRANPVNGRKALYAGSHASHIAGMPDEEGRALLNELLEFATRDDRTYMHQWQVGDLVLYDNRAALHRARPYAITEHARILHRTTVAGEGPTVN